MAASGKCDAVIGLGMVIQGEDNTLRVKVEDIAYHTRAVSRGVQRR